MRKKNKIYKVYRGIRNQYKIDVCVANFIINPLNSKKDIYNSIELNPRLDLVNHSPDGFNWGYGGSGPAQLALAILCDYFNDDKKAILLYQKFKWAFVAHIQTDEWDLTETHLKTVLNHLSDGCLATVGLGLTPPLDRHLEEPSK